MFGTVLLQCHVAHLVADGQVGAGRVPEGAEIAFELYGFSSLRNVFTAETVAGTLHTRPVVLVEGLTLIALLY